MRYLLSFLSLGWAFGNHKGTALGRLIWVGFIAIIVTLIAIWLIWAFKNAPYCEELDCDPAQREFDRGMDFGPIWDSGA